MPQKVYKSEPKQMVCNNCFQPLLGWKEADGVVKGRCPNCGSTVKAGLKNRRTIEMIIIAPKGQEVIW